MRTSLSLLRPFSDPVSLVGDPVRAAGWYGSNTGLHSFSIRLLNFRGRIQMQGSLATIPSSVDWFSLLPNHAAYIQFPRTDYVRYNNTEGETCTIGFNFIGNMLWVRACVDRSYFQASHLPVTALGAYGIVDYVLVNY